MNTESIFIYTINIMVFTHIDAVAIVVGIATPHEIMPPQILVASIIICKEGIAAKNCRREI